MTARTPERQAKLDRVVQNRQRDIVLVLEDIYDPHNASAVFRSCDIFGIQHIHLVFDKQAPFNPKKIGARSSASANKWLDFTTHSDITACLTLSLIHI